MADKLKLKGFPVATNGSKISRTITISCRKVEAGTKSLNKKVKMEYKRIIVGDQEIKVPSLSLGALPIAGIVFLIWLLSGVYIVGPDEVGVVQTFGKYSRAGQSGLNYHFPYPIERVLTPKVTKVNRVDVGFRTL